MEWKDTVTLATKMPAYDEILRNRGTTRRENALMAYRHKIPVTVPNTFIDIAIIQACPDIDRYSGLTQGKDAWGVEWKYVPSAMAPMPLEGNILMEDIADWRKVVKFPDLEAIDWEKQAQIDLHTDWADANSGKGIHPLKNGKTALDAGQACLVLLLNGPFERMHALMGFEGALMALALDPESCYDFVGAFTDYRIAYIRKIKKYYPADIINCHDDYGTKDSLFMSMDTWRKIFKPHLQRLVREVHDLGLIYQHHSCGYIEPLIPELVEIGVDALDPLQGGSNPNLAELKRQYGDRLTFVGGFDNQGILDVPSTTEEEIREEYKRTLNALAPGGSYVSYVVCLGGKAVPTCLAEHLRIGIDFYQKSENTPHSNDL
jgi:hypothetical protein